MQNAIANDMQNVLDDIVEPAIQKIIMDEFAENIYFPLHYIDHWTLLTLDYVTLQWRHYDSSRPETRSTFRSNPSYKQALDMVRKDYMNQHSNIK